MKPDLIEETGPVKKANKATKNTASMEKGIMQPKGNAGPRQRDSSQKARKYAKKGNEAQAAGEAHFKSMGRDASKKESKIDRIWRILKLMEAVDPEERNLRLHKVAKSAKKQRAAADVAWGARKDHPSASDAAAAHIAKAAHAKDIVKNYRKPRDSQSPLSDTFRSAGRGNKRRRVSTVAGNKERRSYNYGGKGADPEERKLRLHKVAQAAKKQDVATGYADKAVTKSHRETPNNQSDRLHIADKSYAHGAKADHARDIVKNYKKPRKDQSPLRSRTSSREYKRTTAADVKANQWKKESTIERAMRVVAEAQLTLNRVKVISKASKVAGDAAKKGPSAGAAALKGRVNRVMNKVDQPKGKTYDAVALKKKKGSYNDRPNGMTLKPKPFVSKDAYVKPKRESAVARAMRVMEEAQEQADKWLANMENLEEGNPLAAMHKHQEAGRHFIVVSTDRPNLSKKEVKTRNKELVSHAREAGYGVRKAEGHYEGTKETSHVIHAKAPGKEAGAELVAFGRKMGHKYDQDSVLHHNGKSARLIGTNKTGYPGKGNAEKVGSKLKFNNPASPFQTEMRPGKKKSPARFTT